MKKLQHIALGLALAAVLACGAEVSAKSLGRGRIVSGVITRIDIRSRTVELREDRSGRILVAHVAEGALLPTYTGSSAVQPLERLQPGYILRGIVVRD
jgi:hypothetical protein